MDYYYPHFKSDLSKKILAEIQQIYLGTVGDNDVYGVDCDAVLGHRIDMDFTNGGNDGRYRYVPNKTLWVDMAYSSPRIAHTLIHEGTESPLMVLCGLSYDNAHDISNVYEDIALQSIRRGEINIQNTADAICFVDKWLKRLVPPLINHVLIHIDAYDSTFAFCDI